MTFGEIFKSYRKELSLTQEEIANQLNVTPQAVSKWETNLGTPDISLLIPISVIFGITVDELLGKSRKSFDEIQSEINQLDSTEKDIINKYKSLQKMLKLNPTSTYLLLALLETIIKILKHRKKHLAEEDIKQYVKDAEIYSKVLIERGDISSYDKHGYGLLAQVYMYAEDYDRAKSTIKNLPWTRFNQYRSRGDLAFLQNDYEKARLEYGNSINNSLSWMFFELEQLYKTYSKTDSFKAKLYLDAMYKLHKSFFDGEDDGCMSYFLRFACMELAVTYSCWDDKEIALNYLDEYAESIIKQKYTIQNKVQQNSKLFPKYEYPIDKINQNGINKMLSRKGFDHIRNHERFKLIEEKLNK